MSETLKPCPFCGDLQVAVNVLDYPDSEPTFYVGCRECGGTGGEYVAAAAAAAAWNRRAEESDPMAKREHTLTITVTADSIAILHTAATLFLDNLADTPQSSLAIPWGELFDLHWAIPDSTPGKAALGRFLDDFAPQVSPHTPEADHD